LGVVGKGICPNLDTAELSIYILAVIGITNHISTTAEYIDT
jgi:hypothetical protein